LRLGASLLGARCKLRMEAFRALASLKGPGIRPLRGERRAAGKVKSYRPARAFRCAATLRPKADRS
jgi:hypothetical protein